MSRHEDEDGIDGPLERAFDRAMKEDTRAFRQGQRVTTPRGPGKVAYVRMAAPDYTEPAAVSVVLDARAEDGRYAGTIMDAALVTPIDGAAS